MRQAYILVATTLYAVALNAVGSRIPPTEATPVQLPPPADVASMFATQRARTSEGLLLFFPEARVEGATDIVEFRSRPDGISHAFVALGKRLPDGSVYFYAAAGFYPSEKPSNITPWQYFKRALVAPGAIYYKISDINHNVSYVVDVNPVQARMVQHIIKNYGARHYNIPSNYCVDLAKNVADFLGLHYSWLPNGLLPNHFTKSLIQLNKGDEPSKKAALDDAWAKSLIEYRRDTNKIVTREIILGAARQIFGGQMKLPLPMANPSPPGIYEHHFDMPRKPSTADDMGMKMTPYVPPESKSKK